MPAEPAPPFPAVEAVAEETSSREVNTMLRAGWRLLVVVAAHDGAGGHPVYVLGKPAVGIPKALRADSQDP